MISTGWRLATGADVVPLTALTQQNYWREMDSIFCIDPQWGQHQLTRSIVDQFYDPGSALVAVNQGPAGHRAYTWVERGQRAPWSRDEMAAVRIAHLDLALPARTRVRLLQDMISLWEEWAVHNSIPIVCSATVRGDQAGFLRLHQQAGYECRGSICYRRVIAGERESSPAATGTC